MLAIVVNRKTLLEAELVAIDLWNKETANKRAPSEDEEIAFDARMIRRAAILGELLEISRGN